MAELLRSFLLSDYDSSLAGRFSIIGTHTAAELIINIG